MAFVGQLPGLPQRLTKLYSDSKHSADVVTEQERHDDAPELTSLHRKFRIQKDRYIAWGLEWSDDKKGSIDESIGKAGLTETVSSVMRTIKEIYSEAEQLLQRSTKSKLAASEKSKALGDSEGDWRPADRSRYEDLYKDLEKSIDILYDLSRSRRALEAGSYPSFSTPPSEKPASSTLSAEPVFLEQDYSGSSVTLINPTSRVPTATTLVEADLPPKLDHSTLNLPVEEPPSYDSLYQGSSPSRVIAFLRLSDSGSNVRRLSLRKTSNVPVVVDYANFDATYKATGVAPPSQRLDGLLQFIARSKSSLGPDEPECKGYFEDPDHPRIGLVYEIPRMFRDNSLGSRQTRESLKPTTLLQFLRLTPKVQSAATAATGYGTPALECRFRLARQLILSLSRLHEDGLVHKRVNSGNILFFQDPKSKSILTPKSMSKPPSYNLSHPFMCSYDLYSEYNVDRSGDTSQWCIYRHPFDPIATGGEHKDYSWQHDLYALGLILLEVGLWIPIGDIFKSKYSLSDFRNRILSIWVRKLAAKCGSAYMGLVEECLLAADRLWSGELPRNVYERIRQRLHRCCLLDETEVQSSASSMLHHNPPATPPISHSSRAPSEIGDAMGSRRMSMNSQLSDQDSTPPTPDSHSIPQPIALRQKSQDTISQLLGKIPEDPEVPPSPKESIRERVFGARWGSPSAAGAAPQRLPRTPTKPRDDSDNASISSVSSNYKTAAEVIQRAWRTYKEKMSIMEFSPQRSSTRLQRSTSNTSFRVPGLLRHPSTFSVTETIAEVEKEPVVEPVPELEPVPEPEPEPVPEPELVPAPEPVEEIQPILNPQITIETAPAPTRQKLRIHPLKISQDRLDQWHNTMLPQLEKLIGRVLKDSPETVSIDLVSVGETQITSRPTIFISCSSTGRVKAALTRKFQYDQTVFDLKVRKGKIRRSKVSRSRSSRKPSQRSMVNEGMYPVRNPFHYVRPLCGASIGAYTDRGHLPPVSYGGVVLVDGETYGMSVHHLLDAPSEDDSSEFGDEEEDITRSSARPDHSAMLAGMGSQPTFLDAEEMEDLPFEISDESENDYSDDGYESLDDLLAESDTDAESDAGTQGDIDGIVPGQGESILVTQPALDDVVDGFFPTLEDRDEEHLDSHKLGHVHASSGIRRWNREGIVHEIDWALLKLDDNRLQPFNLIQGGRKYCRSACPNFCPNLREPVHRPRYGPEDDEYPNQVADADSLGNLRVHCFGRTSGLQGGIIGSAMSSLKIYQRGSFSRSWHVMGGNFGVGGDSGAWVIDNEQGRVCGHVLAFCERRRLAYICPMEVLLEDIKRTLGARKICLPGGEVDERSRDTVSPIRRLMERTELSNIEPLSRPLRSRSPAMDIAPYIEYVKPSPEGQAQVV